LPNRCMTKFDHLKWRKDFRAANERGTGFRELRAAIFQDTVGFVRANGYDCGGVHVEIKSSDIVTEYFGCPDKLTPNNVYNTKFAVIAADCLETAQLLVSAGLNPCVLNMASRQNPGGGVLGGAGAQEENLFRRTNIFVSLYQFAPYASEYGVTRSDKSYPLNRDTGGYIPAMLLFFVVQKKMGIACCGIP